MSNGMVELMMDGVLDYLIDAGTFKAPAGRVLSGLASEILGRSVAVGDPEYSAVSHAVINLEELELITVERSYSSKRHRANVVLSVTLNEE